MLAGYCHGMQKSVGSEWLVCIEFTFVLSYNTMVGLRAIAIFNMYSLASRRDERRLVMFFLSMSGMMNVD